MRLFLLAVGVGVVLLVIGRSVSRSTQRLRDAGLYPPTGTGAPADVELLLVQRHKIAAIKLYRELHGTDLKTSKEAVEALESKLRQEGRLG